MTSFIFLAPYYGGIFALLIVYGILLYSMEVRRHRQLLDFCEEGSHPWQEYAKGSKIRHLCHGLGLASAVFCVLALMRPAWDPHDTPVANQGRDLIFILDVSRSMLAKDAFPHRMELAKEAIRSSLDVDKGDRYALLVFAGSSSIKSPLTQDKDFILEMLEKSDDHSVSQGGTFMGDALMKAIDKLIPPSTASACDIILLSDGEDLGPTAQKALEKIAKIGCRFIVIGIGDSQYGARIPEDDGQKFVRYKGQEVWTKQDTQALSQMAKFVPHGVYYNAGQSHFNLGKILKELRQLWPGPERAEDQRRTYTEGYLTMLWLACISFGLSLALRIRWRSSKLAMLLWLACQASSAELKAQDTELIREVFIKAEHFFKSESYAEAEACFKNAGDLARDSETIIPCRFNEALSAIYNGQKTEADLKSLASPDTVDPERFMENCDDEDDIPVSPEEHYQRAALVLKSLLEFNPRHQNAARHLQWCMEKLRLNVSQPSDQESKPNDEDQENQKQKSDAENQNKEDSEDEASEDGDKGNANSKNANNDSDDSNSQDQAYQTEQIQLPPPTSSAQDILKQRERNGLVRKKNPTKKISSVEKDW